MAPWDERRLLLLAVYQIGCYFALTLGYVIFISQCRKRLASYLITHSALSKDGKTLLVVKGTKERNPPVEIRDGIYHVKALRIPVQPVPAKFYYGLVAGGVVLGMLTWSLIWRGGWAGPARGFAFLASLMVVSLVIDGWRNHLTSARWWPSLSVFCCASLFGALVWTLETWTSCTGDFYGAISAAQKLDKHDPAQMDRIKVLYSFVKDTTGVVLAVFFSICIGLGVSIIKSSRRYESVGLDTCVAGWSAWLCFWGALGWLGIMGGSFLGGCVYALGAFMRDLPVSQP